MANISEVKINGDIYALKDSGIITMRTTLSYVNATTMRGEFTLDSEPECVFAQVR